MNKEKFLSFGAGDFIVCARYFRNLLLFIVTTVKWRRV